MALLADALTASRLILAPALGLALAMQRPSIAVVVLVMAWLTDVFDGVAARAATSETRLGVWDFRIDLLLGIAVLAGLGAAGRVPVSVAIVVIVLGTGGTLQTGNPAPGMVMMTVSYAALFWSLFADRPGLWWLPFVAVPALIMLEAKRTFTVILPAFFRSAAGLHRGPGGGIGPILDDWAKSRTDRRAGNSDPRWSYRR